MKVELTKYPQAEDYMEAKEAALVTIGRNEVGQAPDDNWLHRMADAGHSPMRELTFKFLITDLPYWVSNELCRHHVGVEKFVKSQRNDRQYGEKFDRNYAPQNSPVNVRITLNTEALINMAHKRLCHQATKEMQTLVGLMCDAAERACPWLIGLLVPMCDYRGGVCHEFHGCGRRIHVRELKGGQD